MRKKAIIAVILVMLGLFVFILSCGDDDPVGPTPTDSEHLFYVGAKFGSLVKVFSVEQEKFTDSFHIDGIAETDTMMCLRIIGDDSLLSVATNKKTYFIDLASRGIIDSINARYTIFSRNSNYYCHYNSDQIRYNLRKYPENTIILDTIACFFYAFDNDSKCFTYAKPYLIDGQTFMDLSFYEIETDSLATFTNQMAGLSLAVTLMAPVMESRKVFYGGLSKLFNFLGVTDFAHDTIVTRMLKSFPEGDVMPILSPDNRYLYFSIVVREFWGETIDGNIYVFNAATEDSIATIDYEGMRQSGEIAITRDNQYMLVGPRNEFNDETNICLINARSFQVIGVYDFQELPGSITSKWAAQTGEFL